MGVIAEHIKKKLEQDLRSKGLLIWLDKENEFTALVDGWIEQKKEGLFHYDIFAFRGSFLELMVQSQNVLSTKDMPKCVIHMPGFNEQDIKDTPVLEAYKSGNRWRVSLETMVREAAQGRLSEEQIHHLLSQQDQSLFKVEEYISQEADIPQEVKSLLRKYSEDGFLLEFIKDPAKINKELCLPADKCFPILMDYFDKLVGLDDGWKDDWNHHQVDCSHPDDQVDLLVSYLMTMEFVHDLKTTPDSARLKRLKKKQKEYSNKASELLHELRKNNPKLYIKLAEQVETNLTPNECRLSPDELGSLDTFRFEADTFLREAMSALENRQWHDALKLAQVRLPISANKRKKGLVANTFWLQQDRSRLWLWEWIEIASDLGIETEKVKQEVLDLSAATLKHEEVTELYAEKWWPMDKIHREFSSLSERYLSTHSDLHIKAFIEIRKSLYSQYRDCIDRQSALWNHVCESKGFLPEDKFQQRNFFANWVKPALQKKKKLAVFFVDALRYELGHELVEELQAICGKKPKVLSMLAELPTITAVGMNALIPVVENSKLTPIYDKKRFITGFQGGQRQVKTPDEREKTLRDHAGVDTSWIRLEDFLSFSDRKLKKTTSAELLVVTALDIDKMGESDALKYGLNYFEVGIARLKTAVMKLQENGYDEFIITSDHGFLLGDESLESGKAAKLESVDRRYAFGTERNSENLVSVDAHQLYYDSAAHNADNWFTFERSTHLLTNQSGTSFYHGGNTLQERLVPVISFSLTQAAYDSKGTFDLNIQKLPGVMGFHKVSIHVKSNVQGLFSLPHVELQLVSDQEDVVDVEIGDIVGAQRMGDVLTLPVDQTSELYFKLKGTRSKAQVIFKPTQKGTKLENSSYGEYFEVENNALGFVQDEPEKKSKKVSQTPTTYSENIPQEFHTALAHLEKHGSLTEKFLVNTLGSDGSAGRKSRRFANKISEWLKDLPFDVCIEQTAEGKEYRKQ
jgi:hypothetical protein